MIPKVQMPVIGIAQIDLPTASLAYYTAHHAHTSSDAEGSDTLSCFPLVFDMILV